MKSKKLTKLRLDPKNARRHPERNDQLVEKSLKEVGAFRSVGADAEGIIRAGNKTYEKALKLGYKIKVVKGKPNELVVVQRDDLKGKKAVRAALLDNVTSDSSAYEYELETLRALVEDDDFLAQLTQEDPHLKTILARDPANVSFGEYDESVENEVKKVTCPNCGTEIPI